MAKLDVNQSIYQAWKENNKEYWDTFAIDYFGNQFSYRQMDEMIDDYCRAFHALGLTSKSTIAFCSLSLVSTLVGFLAANKMGIRTTFIAAALLVANPIGTINAPEVEAIFVLDKFLPVVAETLSHTTIKHIIVTSVADNIENIPEVLPEQIKFALSNSGFDMVAKDSPVADKLIKLSDFVAKGQETDTAVREIHTPNETAFIMYSSGSTGMPKGIERTNEATINMINTVSAPELNRGDIRGFRNGVFVPPIASTVIVHILIEPLVLGAVAVLNPFFDKNNFPYDIYRFGINYIVGAPSWFTMFQKAELPPNALKGLFFAFYAGEPISYELAKGISETFQKLGAPRPAIPCYGMSEIGPATTMDIRDDLQLVNRVGRFLPGVKARILDEDGKEVKVGERGFLEVNVDGIGTAMKGYFQAPEKTDEFWTEDHYARTGDIATVDKDGIYDIVGRGKDSFFDKAGVRHFMFDIEGFIYHDDAVMEAEVTRLLIDDGETQIPVAHIVLETDQKGNVTEVLKRIVKNATKELPKEERPAGYRFISSFILNPVSLKRDYLILESIRTGYYNIDSDGKIYEVDFPVLGDLVKRETEHVVIHESTDKRKTA